MLSELYCDSTLTHTHTRTPTTSLLLLLSQLTDQQQQGTAIDFTAAAVAVAAASPPAYHLLPELKWERFVSPFSASPSNGRFLESAISGDGHVSIPESAAILVVAGVQASIGVGRAQLTNNNFFDFTKTSDAARATNF